MVGAWKMRDGGVGLWFGLKPDAESQGLANL